MSEIIELRETQMTKAAQSILVTLTETALLDPDKDVRQRAQHAIGQLFDWRVTGGCCMDNQMFLRLEDTNSIYIADVPKTYGDLPPTLHDFCIPQ